jgi:arylsulfatase A-like enzyme
MVRVTLNQLLLRPVVAFIFWSTTTTTPTIGATFADTNNTYSHNNNNNNNNNDGDATTITTSATTSTRTTTTTTTTTDTQSKEYINTDSTLPSDHNDDDVKAVPVPVVLPNIILFLADNLGYADISWLRNNHHYTTNPIYQTSSFNSTTTTTTATTTPNIDSIGQNGKTFYNWNSITHLCSASRASILTGNYPARFGIYPGTFQPDSSYGLQPPSGNTSSSSSSSSRHSTITLVSLLKQRSSRRRTTSKDNTTQQEQEQQPYTTKMIGKWHLGHAYDQQYLPTYHGFDTYIGIPYHMSGGSIDNHICTYDYDNDNDQNNIHRNKQWLPLYNNTQIIQQPVNVHSLGQLYSHEATQFIQQQIYEKPLSPYFLYMSFSHVHQLCASYTLPEQTTCQWSGHNNNGNSSSDRNKSSTFIDALQEMDMIVGNILQTLHETKSINNTIIIFTSDNGPWLAEQSCSGLRGPFHAQWYVIHSFIIIIIIIVICFIKILINFVFLVVFLQRLRDNVPQNCTACPHEYVSNPTIDRPRRCTLSRKKRQLSSPFKNHIIDHNSYSYSNNDDNDNETDEEIVQSMDGVHCGDDSGLGSIWEANVRMPAMIQWNNHIQPNTSSIALVSSLDITPTILSLVFGPEQDNNLNSGSNENNNNEYDNNIMFDGKDVSSVWLGLNGDNDDDVDTYDSNNERVLFFWRDGFLLSSEPLGPPYGRYDVVAVKVGRIKVWYWTKSAHYNNDKEKYHYPPLLFDTISDPGEAYPIKYEFNDTSNKYTQLVLRVDDLVEEHKKDIASSYPYPLTLKRDSKYIPCIDPSTGCRSSPLVSTKHVSTDT